MTKEEIIVKRQKLENLKIRLEQYEEQYYYYPTKENARRCKDIEKEIADLEKEIENM